MIYAESKTKMGSLTAIDLAMKTVPEGVIMRTDEYSVFPLIGGDARYVFRLEGFQVEETQEK